MSTEETAEPKEGGGFLPASFGELPAFAVSLILHALILGGLLFITFELESRRDEIALESIVDEDFKKDPNQQLEVETDIATSINVVSGGTVSTEVGSSAQPAVSKVQVTESKVMQEPTLNAVVADMSLATDSMIGDDLGEGEVTGEVGAIVEGYGAAMGRLTQELLRMMRNQKVLVVWLFDESYSMKDDREEISQKFGKIYDELGIAEKQDKKLKRNDEVLLTVVASYGDDIHEWTPEPTNDTKLIKSAMLNVPVDDSGKEAMCQSVRDVIRKYRTRANRNKRKLVVIVVSDESGDDGQFVEEAIVEAKRTKAPIYILGRESIFGYPYAHQRWVDEPTGEVFWPKIRRGPETAFPEALQWNGLHERRDAFSAGFGPYEQVRLARDTGGIFFALPGDERELAGRRGSTEKRQFEFLAMKEYQPLLLPRIEYDRQRQKSDFRKMIWDVIVLLNPSENDLLFPSFDRKLNIRSEHFPILIPEFAAESVAQVKKAARAMGIINQVLPMLEKIAPLRATEPSQRWRANYDLSYAQLLAFRVRLFQYLLAMDAHVNASPPVQPKNPKSNEWNIWWDRRNMIVPDEQQYARLKGAFQLKESRAEYLASVTDQKNRALELLKSVKDEHAGTPWAVRAQNEISSGFGMKVNDRLWDPSGNRSEAQKRVPKF